MSCRTETNSKKRKRADRNKNSCAFFYQNGSQCTRAPASGTSYCDKHLDHDDGETAEQKILEELLRIDVKLDHEVMKAGLDEIRTLHSNVVQLLFARYLICVGRVDESWVKDNNPDPRIWDMVCAFEEYVIDLDRQSKRLAGLLIGSGMPNNPYLEATQKPLKHHLQAIKRRQKVGDMVELNTLTCPTWYDRSTHSFTPQFAPPPLPPQQGGNPFAAPIAHAIQETPSSSSPAHQMEVDFNSDL